MTAHVVWNSLRWKTSLAVFIFLVVLYITANLIWLDTWNEKANLRNFNLDLEVPAKQENIEDITSTTENVYSTSNARNGTQDSRYLLDSPSCRILDLDPFSEDAMSLFNPVEFEICNGKPLLTRINHLDNGSFTVSVEEDVVKEYLVLKENLSCCYEAITRGAGEKADSDFSKSQCVQIVGETVLRESDEFILVTCTARDSTLNTSKVVYKDAHAILQVKPEVRTRLEGFKTKRTEDKMERPPSVLMFGIDSVSRLNYRRVMPKTLQHLQSTGWVELNAYNKMGDNTFPNLMAVFTGYNESDAFSICDPTTLEGLDNCSLIWRDFQDNGYATAYSEDAPLINTFNYLKRGFLKQPTDYYARPYFMAMESYLTLKTRSNLEYCLGSVTASERVMNYMLDFTTTFKNDPYFGIFWINTLSHNTLEMSPSVDLKVKEILEELSSRGVLDNSIVFFFSDHGVRFGPIRELHTGLLEERLPFMHIWIPQKFRASHPGLFHYLVENSKKLTTPYDIYMTLQHILSLYSNHTEPPSKGCPNCTSIFKPIPFDRSCAEAGVNAHWCACEMYELLQLEDDNVISVAKFVLQHINNVTLQGYTQCEWLNLNQVLSARGGADVTTGLFNYMIVFETYPAYANFETTVTAKNINEYEIQGSISRINTIGTDGKCVNNSAHQLYCHCKE